LFQGAGGSSMLSIRLSRAEKYVGIAILAIIVLLVFVAAIMRFFSYPLIWSVDLAQLLFIWLCFLGANRALRQRTHLGVDLFIRNLPYRTRLIIELAMAVAVVAFLLALAVEGTQLTILNRERLFGDSGIPYAFVTIAVPVGSLFLALTVVLNVIEALRQTGPKTMLVFSRVVPDEEAGL
jgi:TRAP-type C4-dicarboxylate transport system permease small subunit